MSSTSSCQRGRSAGISISTDGWYPESGAKKANSSLAGTTPPPGIATRQRQSYFSPGRLPWSCVQHWTTKFPFCPLVIAPVTRLTETVKGSVLTFYTFLVFHDGFGLRRAASRLDTLSQRSIANRSLIHFNVIVDSFLNRHLVFITLAPHFQFFPLPPTTLQFLCSKKDWSKALAERRPHRLYSSSCRAELGRGRIVIYNLRFFVPVFDLFIILLHFEFLTRPRRPTKDHGTSKAPPASGFWPIHPARSSLNLVSRKQPPFFTC